MTRVLHTGDTHLGYQQYHVPERREDFLAAFRQVAEDAIADDVDAVVHAGDLFHDRRPTLPDIMGALSVLRTLADADVPFLAVIGNHETKREAQWLDLFESLGLATRLGSDPVRIGDVAFYGLDFVPRAQREELSYDASPHDADHAALVTHGLFEPFDLGEWDVRELLRTVGVEIDAVLLGDNHDPGIKRVEDPTETWVTYSGSTERASADEREERGYNVVIFDDGVDIRRRGLDTREFVFVDVNLGPDEGVERVRERVGQHDLEDAVVVVRIEGDGDPVTPAAVEEFALDSGALVARVTDRREFSDEDAVDVSFADPDAAVRERVRELGLSEAARDVDEMVRASTIPNSSLDDAVEDHVRDLVDDADPAVFDATDDTATPASDTDGEAESDPPHDDSGSTPPADGDEAETHEGDGADRAADTGADSADVTDSADDSEDQATMEEYL